MSAATVPISFHGSINPFLSGPEFLFAIWIAVGFVALVVGLVAVRASTRRLRRSAYPVERAAAFGSTTSSQSSGIRAAA